MAPFIEHRRRSIRLPSHDYSSTGAYFITICTFEREELFGKIKNGHMGLNRFGEIVQHTWNELPSHFPHTALDEFIAMPNHIHGIVWIHEHDDPYGGGMARFCRGMTIRRGMACHAPTYGQFGHPTPRSLPTIIGSFKSAVTKRIHEIHSRGTACCAPTVWQRNYYEHIIRSERALFAIRQYIKNNPARWEGDKNNRRSIFLSSH